VLWAIVAPVDVRHQLARARMLQNQLRLYQRHLGNISVDDFQFAEPVAANILELDRINLVQGPHRTDPLPPPAAVLCKSQVGKAIAHSRHLLPHCQPGHSRGRP
jgi:hypothetical protein